MKIYFVCIAILVFGAMKNSGMKLSRNENYKNLAPNLGKKWVQLLPKLTPNPKAIPFHRVIQKPKKQSPVRGTWKSENCGQASSELAGSYVVNGQEVEPHSYPWQAALFIDSNFFYCGGYLISDQWVLTAGHCTVGTAEFRIVLGAHNLSEVEPSQQTFISTDIITHETYGVDGFLYDDIGLIRLPQNVTFNDYIKPVCLPSYSDEDIGVGVMLTATGWGITEDGTISDTLNQVTNPSISNEECDAIYYDISPDAICTSTDDGNKGTCNGDSGGPLMIVENNVTYSRGITSFGSATGCTTGYPNGYTRTSHFLDWIEEKTGIYINP